MKSIKQVVLALLKSNVTNVNVNEISSLSCLNSQQVKNTFHNLQ